MLSMTIFPQIAILGALYTMINRFQLYDSLRALVLSYMILVLPFTVWVLTSFMRALPRDLEEAAYVDGASPLQTFWYVMLPLVAPGLVTAGLLAFIAAWNEFLFALSFTQTPERYTSRSPSRASPESRGAPSMSRGARSWRRRSS